MRMHNPPHPRKSLKIYG